MSTFQDHLDDFDEAAFEAEYARARAEAGDDDADEGVGIEDFRAYMPAHNYIYIPARDFWPAASVNARVPPVREVDASGKTKMTPAAAWLDRERPVEMMTWAPGLATIVEDRLISDGGWIERVGCSTFNLYRPPTLRHGDAGQARRWVEHVRRVYPDDADHITRWLAHRVQRPNDKINHALVLGGAQGVGKDTLLEPVKAAIGPWNFAEVSPQQMLGRFNGFAKSVILRVSEARDLGDVNRFAFYDHSKIYTAAPPDVIRCDEKFLREHAVMNVTGVVITSNHRSDGIYLPADDRRHFVAWSDLSKDSFEAGYWSELYGWYASGGIAHVAAYLAQLDLSDFDAKAPPPKTEAFWSIVDSNRSPEDAELADVLDKLGRPEATTLAALAAAAPVSFSDWLNDRSNSRKIPHRLEEVGYQAVRNKYAKDGHWTVGGRRSVIYCRSDLSLRDQLAAAERLTEAER